MMRNVKVVLGMVLQLGVPALALAGSATWDGGNSGNWGDVVKWVGDTTFPNGAGEVATFTNSAFSGGGGTILLATSGGLDTDITLGGWSKSTVSGNVRVNLNNVAGGTGKLIFDATSGNATYNSSNQNSTSGDTINVAIQLNDSLTATISGAPAVNFTRVISESGGSRSLTKAGTGTLRLTGTTGANTFSGGVTITNGTLAAEKTGALGSGNITVAESSLTSTATLSITTGVVNAINDSATLSLQSFTVGGANFSTVSLAAGINETIAALFFDGVSQAAGTWGATGSGATFINDNWFTGSGILTVAAVPEPSTYVLAGSGILGLLLLRRRSKV